ncbi:MAG TPA: choice-of-anchor tandem repeat GloVer-containing protein [Terriglobales bacterium]
MQLGISNVSKSGPIAVQRLRLIGALFLVFTAAPLPAQTYQDLYDFNCSTGGCFAQDSGPLTQGADGNLYGTTQAGGNSGVGTIFMFNPSTSTHTDLVSFDGVTAANPVTGLTLASDGNFYGTTYYTTFQHGGFGTVFRFNPPSASLPNGKLTILHIFNGTDGILPSNPPVQGKDGNLYGVTELGTTYRVALSSGKFHQLPNNPGEYGAPLYLASDGNLYGTTPFCGEFSDGCIFQMTTPGGAITVIHSFSGADGKDPDGGVVQERDGNLYGSTYAGGTNDNGVVFQYVMTGPMKGTLNVIHSFDQSYDGAYPDAGLLAASDGFLYGVNMDGGAYGNGTLFQITTTGALNKYVDFTNTGGAAPGQAPTATLMQSTAGALYGVTSFGGANNRGVLYSFTPPNPLLPTLIIEGPIFVLPGVPVVILGNNLGEAVNVTFGDVPASFTPGSNTYLTALVPSAAVDGPITVTLTNPLGQQETLQSQQNLHIVPIITNLDPTSGPVGQEVGIVGGGFVGATKVTFGGVKATKFTVGSPSFIQTYVPVGAKTGKVSVTTPNGTVVSKQTFTVN